MKKSDFYFDLPTELIAQTPIEKRDASRLLVLDKETGAIEHRHFYDIVDYLKTGDCLVLNNSRVLPARLIGIRPTGGSVELLLLREFEDGTWECLSRPGRKTKPGTEIIFGNGELKAVVEDYIPGGNRKSQIYL
jgi:S-adenosylmethionine:tRNA-ribosyltransferase-isomerase (queuine synthetase)